MERIERVKFIDLYSSWFVQCAFPKACVLIGLFLRERFWLVYAYIDVTAELEAAALAGKWIFRERLDRFEKFRALYFLVNKTLPCEAVIQKNNFQRFLVANHPKKFRSARRLIKFWKAVYILGFHSNSSFFSLYFKYNGICFNPVYVMSWGTWFREIQK